MLDHGPCSGETASSSGDEHVPLSVIDICSSCPRELRDMDILALRCESRLKMYFRVTAEKIQQGKGINKIVISSHNIN